MQDDPRLHGPQQIKDLGRVARIGKHAHCLASDNGPHGSADSNGFEAARSQLIEHRAPDESAGTGDKHAHELLGQKEFSTLVEHLLRC
jgi:hypothetical protein